MGCKQGTARSRNVGTILAAVGFFGFILWPIYLANSGSSSSVLSMHTLIPYGDKLAHFALFGGLTFLVNVALGFNTPTNRVVAQRWGTIAVVAFVAAEESSQAFISSRTVDIFDFTADLLGITLGAFVAHLVIEAIE